MKGPGIDPGPFFMLGGFMMTERQAVVRHFVDNNVEVHTPLDMAIYLARDAQESNVLSDQGEYIQKVLNAGYRSTMAKDLFDDIAKGLGPKPKNK